MRLLAQGKPAIRFDFAEPRLVAGIVILASAMAGRVISRRAKR